MFSLDRKIALVTGAASGIGEAISHALANAGAFVYFTDRDADNGRRVTAAVTAEGGRAEFLPLDVTDEAQCAVAAAAVLAGHPAGLDILCNNAGIGHVGTIHTTRGEDLDRLYQVNVRGVFNVSQAFIGPMITRRAGVIVNTASVAGLVGLRDRLAYATTKFAVVGLTKCMALDHAADGIRVNCVCPGRVETPFVKARLREYPDPEAAYREMAESQALGRMGTPEEIAASILYLVSDEAAFVTGSAFVIDGGLSAGKMSATLLVDSQCTLGEGVVWCSRRAAWLWTDIEGRRLWQHRPADNTTRSWRLADRLGSFALCQSGRLLLGLAKQIAIAELDAATGETLPARTLLDLEPGLQTRVNDGRTDRAGHFVFGTMSELPKHEPIGSFYQYSVAHGLRRLELGTIGIPNSLCFSPDGHTIYFCDSLRREIMQATYDAAAATVSSVEVFVDVSGLRGDPDGSIVDANGGLWNAVWGASVIRRFTPGGLLDRQVPVPAKQPTCIAFGGPDLDILAVTSARQDLTDAELAAEPLSGGVFAISAIGAPGLEDARFDDSGLE